MKNITGFHLYGVLMYAIPIAAIFLSPTMEGAYNIVTFISWILFVSVLLTTAEDQKDKTLSHVWERYTSQEEYNRRNLPASVDTICYLFIVLALAFYGRYVMAIFWVFVAGRDFQRRDQVKKHYAVKQQFNLN